MLICVRDLQGCPDEDILAELRGIGLVEDYAADMMWSARAAGRPRQIATPAPIEPRMYGGFRSRPSTRFRMDIRATRRLELARRLAGITDGPSAELEAIPTVPPMVMKSDWLRFTLLWSAIVFTLVGSVVGSIMWYRMKWPR